MRKNKWLPRRLGREPERGPRTIAQVREDAARDGCIYMPQESSPPAKTPTGMGMINPFEGMFNRKMDDFFGPSTSTSSASSKQSFGGGYLSTGYGSLGTGPGSISNSVAYEDDLNPTNEKSSRPVSNGYSRKDEEMPKEPSPIKAFEERQHSVEKKDEQGTGSNPQQQPRPVQRESPGGGVGPSGDAKEETDGNRRENYDQNRRPQNQGHYNNINNYRNDQYHNRRGGNRATGDREQDNYSRQQQHAGNNFRENRDEDTGTSIPPPVDFGDRYSANRSKDRDRRQQQQHPNNDWGNNGNNRQNNEYHRGEPFQRGGRGGRFEGNFNRDGRNNQTGGPPRFNQRPDERFNEPPPVAQPPPRFQRNTSNESEPAEANNTNSTDRLAPRFKKLSLGQGPPERGPADIGGGGPPNREQGGRGMHNRQIIPDQRYQERPPMFQQPPPNFLPDQQRNIGMGGQGKNPMEPNNPRMMFPGGPPPNRMDREGSGGFTDRRSEGTNSRERELGLAGSLVPPRDVELSLRPPSANMLFKPKTPSLLPKSAIARVNEHGSSHLGENSLLGPPPMQMQKVMMQQKEAPILIKQGSLDGKGRKEKNRQAAAAANKGPTRDEVFERVDTILNDLLTLAKTPPQEDKQETADEKQDQPKEDEESKVDDEKEITNENITSEEDPLSIAIETAANRWKENDGWLPSKMTQTAVTHVYKKIVFNSTDQRDIEIILSFLLQLNKDGALDSLYFREAFDKVLNEKTPVKEVNEKGDDKNEQISDEQLILNLAATAQWKIKEKLATLAEVAEMTADKGDRAKVLLIALQGLSKPEKMGEEAVKEIFDSANIKLLDQIVEAEKNDAKLASILKDHQLSFLLPLLTIRQEMANRLDTTDSNADDLAQWISEHVPSQYHTQVDFVVALFSVVFSHIVSTTTLPSKDSAVDKSVQPEKAQVEAEKELVSKFGGVLRPFVASNASLQLTAVYALQVFNHDIGFPKGMLLRSFVNCYELDILDEHAFLQWREDRKHSDDFPGKGKALFQVSANYFESK